MPARDFSNVEGAFRVKALLKLLPTQEGGRQTAIRTGYRPNHVYEYKANSFLQTQTYMGEIQFEDVEEIHPGEEKIVTVYFLNIPSTSAYLTIGRQWWIHEARQLVGTGEILDIL